MSGPGACDQCGALLVGEDPLCFGCMLGGAIDLELANLEVFEEIGRGGMGVVYRAVQTSLDRAVAVKLMTGRHDDRAFRARFGREAKLLARLNHPNIVTIYDWVEDADDPYLIMELIDGESLASEIPMTPTRAIEVGVQICRALEHAHEHGIVHRDIKPSNVLVATDGTIKVADFGIARPTGHGTESALTSTNAVVGTPVFTAPEASTALAPSPQLDIYSLGVLLYHAITGALPIGSFEAIDHPIDEVLRLAMAHRPEARFSTVTDLRRALEALGTRREGVALPTRRQMSARWVAIVGILALGGTAATTAVVLSAGRAPPVEIGTSDADSTGPARPHAGAQISASTDARDAAVADGARDAALAGSRQPEPTRAAAKAAKSRADAAPKRPVAPGALRIHARPWADVTVNGKPIGRVEPPHGRLLSLEPGLHSIVLENPASGRTLTRQARVTSGTTVTVRADLRAEAASSP